MSTNVRELLNQNFPVTTTEHAFQLGSFLKLTFGVGLEDMTAGLSEVKRRLVQNHDATNTDTLGIMLLQRAIRDYYCNPRWLSCQSLNTGPVVANGVAEHLQPALTVTELRKYVLDTVVKSKAYRTALVSELKRCEHANDNIIQVLQEEDYYVTKAKRINQLIPTMEVPKPLETTLPLGGRTVGSRIEQPIKKSPVETLPVLTHDEIRQVVRMIDQLCQSIQDVTDDYNHCYNHLYVIDRDDFNPLEEAAKEIETGDAQYAAKLWQWLGRQFSGDRIEPLADLIAELYSIVLALTLWVDRSIK